MKLKNTKEKALNALRGIKNVVRDVAHPVYAVKRKLAEAKTRGYDKQFQTYKMVNEARGLQDKGNESDPLFRGRAMMKEAQRKAIKGKV